MYKYTYYNHMRILHDQRFHLKAQRICPCSFSLFSDLLANGRRLVSCLSDLWFSVALQNRRNYAS